jgi:hypothetical protein
MKAERWNGNASIFCCVQNGKILGSGDFLIVNRHTNRIHSSHFLLESFNSYGFKTVVLGIR